MVKRHGPHRLALAFALGCAMTGAGKADGSALAAIDVERRDGGLTLAGRVMALVPGQYEARMTIDKSGPSGTTRTTQGGALSLEAGAEGTVATVGLSVTPGDVLAVELVVTQDQRPVASSSLTFGD